MKQNEKRDLVTVTKTIRVINEETGCAIEVAPDPDGLGLVQIVYWEPGYKHPEALFTLPREMAVRVAGAINETTHFMERQETKEATLPVGKR